MLGAKSLHPDHREVASLTLLLNSDACHAFKSLEEILCILVCYCLRGQYLCPDGHILQIVLCSCTSYHYLIQFQSIFFEQEESSGPLVWLHQQFHFLLREAVVRCDNGMSAGWYV